MGYDAVNLGYFESELFLIIRLQRLTTISEHSYRKMPISATGASVYCGMETCRKLQCLLSLL